MMAIQHRNQTQGPSSQRRPLRSITDPNAKARAKHETPLIKRIARNRIKALREAPLSDTIADTFTRNTKFKAPPSWWYRSTSILSHEPGQKLGGGDVIIHRFNNAGQFDAMVGILTRLPSVPGLAGLAPCLFSHDRDRLEIQLQYPYVDISRVVDRIHSGGDYTGPQLRVSEIHQLQETLLKDIPILCASHIALPSDLTFLRMAQPRNPSSACIPLLDAFDLDLYTAPSANTIDWTEHENTMVQRVKTQFQVFKVRVWTRERR